MTRIQRGLEPITQKKPPDGFPEDYSSYEVITVNGITNIIEYHKKEPMFYVADDPNVWRELGVKQTKIGK